MKIVTDFYYPVSADFWETTLADDPLAFPSIRAVEKLASKHECHLLDVCVDIEARDTVRNGMHYHTRKSVDEWLPLLRDLNPDVVLTNGWHGVAKLVASASKNARVIYVCNCEPATLFTPESMWKGAVEFRKEWHLFDTLISATDIGIEQIKTVLPKMKTFMIPIGVNLDLCWQYRLPLDNRENLVCGAGWEERKGGQFTDAVLNWIKKEYRQLVGTNLGGMPRRALIEQLSQSKVLFFPAYSEATARELSDAAATGVMPVVAIESPTNVEHARKLGGVAIQTGMYAAPSLEDPYGVKFTRPVQDVALQLIDIAENLKEYKPDLSEFDARLTIDQYISVIDPTLSESSQCPEPPRSEHVPDSSGT